LLAKTAGTEKNVMAIKSSQMMVKSKMDAALMGFLLVFLIQALFDL
jgi:hypothetical protein